MVTSFKDIELPSERVRNTGSNHAPRVHFYGILLIGSTSFALALATASECHSIFYFPSLLYGLVLWGWWGSIASTLWTVGFKRPTILGISPAALAGDLLLGCWLGVVHILLLGSLGFMDANWRLHASVYTISMALLNVNRFGIEILIYGFVLGMVGIVHFQMRAQRDAMRSLELQKQLSEAQLRAADAVGAALPV